MAAETPTTAPGVVVVRETRRGTFQQEIISGPHRLLADEPKNVGGLDSGLGLTISCWPRSGRARQ